MCKVTLVTRVACGSRLFFFFLSVTLWQMHVRPLSCHTHPLQRPAFLPRPVFHVHTQKFTSDFYEFGFFFIFSCFGGVFFRENVRFCRHKCKETCFEQNMTDVFIF